MFVLKMSGTLAYANHDEPSEDLHQVRAQDDYRDALKKLVVLVVPEIEAGIHERSVAGDINKIVLNS